MKPSTTSTKKRFKSILFKSLAIAFWILVWEALALRINSELIIATPTAVAARLRDMIFQPEAYKTLLGSLLRISAGFVAAFFAGGILAGCAAKFKPIKGLLSPIIRVIKSTPVASFIILAIIWFGSGRLSVFISFLMVLPVIYLNLLEGIESADRGLSEMASIYRMPARKRIFYVLMPQLMPFVLSACSVALGLCWKSGVAAEVIGITGGSIGERLYRAKLYFETAELLAWTVVIIAVSTCLEKLVMLILRRISALPTSRFDSKARLFPSTADSNISIDTDTTGTQSDCGTPGSGIILENISKSFGERAVLRDVSLTISPSEHIALRGHSGAGKTTLSRIICGLEAPDSGSIHMDSAASIAVVFQEDRLIEAISAIGNIIAVGGDAGRAYRLLSDFGFTDELIFKPAVNLSGGEKRRCAIARALLFSSDIVIMDEPFKGIDRETLETAVLPKVKELTAGRTLILITHSEDEAAVLCDSCLQL